MINSEIDHVYVIVNFLSQVVFGFLLFLGMVMFANKVETKLPKRLKISYQEPCKKHIISIIVYFQNISIPPTKGTFTLDPPPPPPWNFHCTLYGVLVIAPLLLGISVNFQLCWVPSESIFVSKILFTYYCTQKIIFLQQ